MSSNRVKLRHLALASLVAGSSAMAAEPVSTPAASPNSALAAAPPGAGAVRAVRDKQTGKLRRATEAEMAELMEAEKAQRAAQGQPDPATAEPARQIRVHGNGMVSAVLGPEHLVTVKAVRGPDGRLVRTHTHPAHEHPSSQPQQRPTE